MARLIDATRIEQYILNNCSDNEEVNAIYGEIINAPTIEAEPTKHGRWSRERLPSIDGGSYEVFRCNLCNEAFNWRTAYCPWCGARMDLIGEDKSHLFAESVMMGMDGGENG